MKNLLFVVAHKPYGLQLPPPYQTIVVGNHDFQIKNAWLDNTLDNIADKNGSFCELTAMYWVWKNKLNDYDTFGLMHYRRYLTKKSFSNQSKDFIGNAEIDKALSKCDIILPKKIYRNYNHAKMYFRGEGQKKDLDELKAVIAELYPDYLTAMKIYLKRKSGCFSNMFIMGRERFNDYSNWLFRILFELEKRIDISNYSIQQKRVFGYLSEMLLDIWVIKNHLKIKYYPYAFSELDKKGQLKWAIKTFFHVNLWHPRVFLHLDK